MDASKVEVDFSVEGTVFAGDAERRHAEALFASVLQQLEAAAITQLATPYYRLEMVRQIRDCAQCSDAYLRTFFSAIGVDMASTAAIDTAALAGKVVAFTDYLLVNFFLPLRIFALRKPRFGYLSIPTSARDSPAIVAARAKALAILDVFDKDVHRLITGTDIDGPANALTLTADCYAEFGSFRMYFEATGVPGTYRIASYLWPMLSRVPKPLTQTLFQSPTIDAPHPRLLAVHAAIAKVLHTSGAGVHCDGILRDIDDLPIVESDGKTNLETIVALRLNGWWDGRGLY